MAVDGPSGSGKSSASKGVARALGLRYLDTGAMYRALTWWLMSQEADITDETLVASRAAEPAIEVSTDPDDPWTRVDGRDVSSEIRTREVSAQVSAVAAVPEVRRHLIGQQRAIIAAARPGIVAEGRDIGTVVAPDAQLKVFLTAHSQARAERRAAAMMARCRLMRCRRTLGTPATALTWAETSRVRISAETSRPSTRVHGSSGSVLTSMAGSAARLATSVSSVMSARADISHQVSARYIAPVSR